MRYTQGPTNFLCFILISLILHVFILYGKIKENIPTTKCEIEITLGGTAYASNPPPKKEDKKEKSLNPKKNVSTKKSTPPKKKIDSNPPQTKPQVKKSLHSPQKNVKKIKKEKKKRKALKTTQQEKEQPKTKNTSHNRQPPKKSTTYVKKKAVEKKAPSTTERKYESTKMTESPAAPKVTAQKNFKKQGATIQQNGLKNYLSHIRQIIEAHKYYPYNARVFGREGKVAVSFTIGKDGKIEDVMIVTPCKHKTLNRAAIKTLHRSSPLPPPPQHLSPPINVTLTLVFQLN